MAFPPGPQVTQNVHIYFGNIVLVRSSQDFLTKPISSNPNFYSFIASAIHLLLRLFIRYFCTVCRGKLIIAHQFPPFCIFCN
jgi:hypothetical protein